MVWVSITAVLCLIVLAGFYAGIETGTYALNRLRLRSQAALGDKRAKRLQTVLADPVGFIGTALIGHNAAVFGATSIVTGLISVHVSERYSELVATLALALPMFALAEIIPKNLFRKLPGILMFRVSLLAYLSQRTFRPVVIVLLWIAGVCHRCVGAPRSAGAPAPLGADLEYLLAEELPVVRLSPYQRFLARHIIGLSSRMVREVAVPWDNVAKVRQGVDAAGLAALVRTTGHSRFVVVDDQDRPVATTSILDTFFGQGEQRPPQTLSADQGILDALHQLQQQRVTMAVVYDKDRPSGIITLKDLLEEIVGELVEW